MVFFNNFHKNASNQQKSLVLIYEARFDGEKKLTKGMFFFVILT